MKRRAIRFACVSAGLLAVVVVTRAQDRSATQASSDPRVGLKAGLRDAGQAARNMELVTNLPKPEGFFDPTAPAGWPAPPEQPAGGGGPVSGGDPSAAAPAPAAAGRPALSERQRVEGQPGAQTPGAPPQPALSEQPRAEGPPANILSFTNSDLAFSGNHLFQGNYHGFMTYDIENTKRPRLIASIVCPGGQGDVSVHGNLLFMSVQDTRGRLDCGTQGVQAPVSAERFRGIRIFDISDRRKPKQVAAVQTCRGSHTHTLVRDMKDKGNIYVYNSGTSAVRSGEELAGCSGLKPEEDANTALFSIDVIKVPLNTPEKAAIVNRPRIFADPETGNIAGLWPGGDHGAGTQSSRITSQCHDITVFSEVGLAAGACSGNGILMDISDPVHPVRLDHVVDKSFAFWHSATFNNDGTKIVFTDEWGGGARPRCRAIDPPTWGGNAIFDIIDRKLQFRGYYKMPAAQSEQENCVAHNGSIIPVPGRDIMVQAWYQGGLSVFDFTDSANPVEIAFFDRGPIDATQLFSGGYWSTYWYNGHVYGAEIARGIDVFRLLPSEYLSRNEIDAATQVRFEVFNAQQQPRVAWPATFVVARAYLDQLTRSRGPQDERIATLKSAIDRADRRNPSARDLEHLDTLAAQLERDASVTTGRDVDRMRALAATIKARTARLR